MSGFAGGTTTNPDYYDVVDGTTGHAEVVKVTFDTNILSLADVLDIFWAMHDPTTLNRQGHDVGTQYRSIILYDSEVQHEVVKRSVEAVSKLWNDPITTEVKLLDVFYRADDTHQDYFAKHPEAGYCQVVINPKLLKLKRAFAKRIKQ